MTMQEAQLLAQDGVTLVATVEVPEFPNNPRLVICDINYTDSKTPVENDSPNLLYFVGDGVTYGVDYLTYKQVVAYEVEP